MSSPLLPPLSGKILAKNCCSDSYCLASPKSEASHVFETDITDSCNELEFSILSAGLLSTPKQASEKVLMPHASSSHTLRTSSPVEILFSDSDHGSDSDYIPDYDDCSV